MAQSIGNVLEEGFELIKKNYLKFLLLYILVAFVFLLIALIGVAVILILTPVLTNAYVVLAGFFFVVFVLIIFLVEPLLIGTYYSMALQGLKGEISLTYALAQAKSRYVKLLWTMALEALIYVLIDALIFAPLIIPAMGLINAYSATGSSSGAQFDSAVFSLIGIGLLVVLVYFVATAILSPILYEAVPLVMLEGVSGTKAIKESVDMGKKNFWSILFLIIGIALIYFGIDFLQGILIFIVSLMNQLAGSVLRLILSVLIGSFMVAWISALPIIFYRDYLSKNKSKASRKR